MESRRVFLGFLVADFVFSNGYHVDTITFSGHGLRKSPIFDEETKHMSFGPASCSRTKTSEPKKIEKIIHTESYLSKMNYFFQVTNLFAPLCVCV